MSPRFWRRAARTTTTRTAPAGPEGPEPPPALAALLALAADRATGVLEFPGEPGAAVHLAEGLVSQVVSPGVAATGDAADAALDIVAGAGAGRPDTRFTPGEWCTTPLSRPLEVGALLTEVTRRQRVLAAIAARARPDEPLTRAGRLPVGRVRLSARQWDLVRLADGRHTPRELARRLGSGVFATTVEAATLVRAGLLAPVTGEPVTPAPFLEAVRGT